MVDELAIIRSMHTMTFQHEEALWVMHSGTRQDGRPSLGSWVTFALGSENQNLPAYVALCDPKGLPINGAKSWSNGWMPPIYQGTPLRSEGMPVLNLYPEQPRSDAVRLGRHDLLRKLNQEHRRLHPGELELDARIESYELAARMQLSATDALDLSQESKATRELYGLDNDVTLSYGTRCLIARRLVERGVRFVQIFMRGQPWDTHSKSRKQISKCCAETDLPAAGLLKDLKQPRPAGYNSSHPGVVSLGDNRSRRTATAGITIPRPSARFWPVAVSRGGRCTVLPMISVISLSRIPSECRIFTPPCCTCWASTTTGSRYPTTGAPSV